MSNELLLIINVLVVYGSVLLFFKLFGSTGLISFVAFATIAANIEVLILVKAFGIEQTLGNIVFAANFLITDILSENYGKKKAIQAANIGICISALFIVISQIWLAYTPSANDFAMPAMQTIFSNTPRVMIAGLVVYAICQRIDIVLYDAWWKCTEKLCGDSKKYLWVRNNGSTLISQLLNAVLFTFAAFAFTYDMGTLISIALSSYGIFVVTSLFDTPIAYLARNICSHNRK